MKNNDAELRLALVCYGGVSLAVYMHGVTKEIHKLLCAARKFDERLHANPFPGGTEKVYFDVLTAIAETGPRLEVSVDIIGGTSAGGINGIALSKAIACNASLDPLKKVWIEDGDIRKLLRGTPVFGLGVQLVATVLRQLPRLWRPSSPLRGEHMSKLLMEALGEMDPAPGSEVQPLVPATTPELQLYVPATDLDGYDVLIPTGIGGASNRDRDYRQVLAFSGEGKTLPQFGADYTADLAFAGRATASFPGAFAPVSQRSFLDEAGSDAEVRLHPEVFLCQSDSDRAGVYFVDGGVLDNAPFDLVVDAIARRPAVTRVYRQVVYIEPDPGQELYSTIRDKPSDKRRWLKDLVTVSTVKGSHPITTALTELWNMNLRIAEVKAIAEQQELYVKKRTNTVLIGKLPAERRRVAPESVEAISTTALLGELAASRGNSLSDSVIQELSDEVYAQARDSMGPAWSTYQRLKFEAVLVRLATGISSYLGYSRPSAKAGFVRATWVEWMRRHPAWQPGHTRALGDVLRPADMPYRARRLMFILTGVNELYDFVDKETGWSPPAAQVDELKTHVWSMLENIRATTATAIAELEAEGALNVFRLSDREAVAHKPDAFAQNNADQLQDVFTRYTAKLAGARDDSHELLDTFQRVAAAWESTTAKDSLLNRYLGFALWDGILFPTISLAELPQLSEIPVAQFSPLTATALTAPVEERGKLRPPKDGESKPAKLKGLPVHHFAAFFEAKYRENDYLWGRLDGAELILKMLSDVADASAPEPGTASLSAAGERPNFLADALDAVLSDEKGLTRVAALHTYLAGQVDALHQASVSSVP